MGLRRFLATYGAPLAPPLPGATTVGGALPFLLNATPDLPQGFGDRLRWFAIKSADARGVAATLGLGIPHRANWATGIAAAAELSSAHGWVFVAPPIEGWSFVVGAGIGAPDQRPGLTGAHQRVAQQFERRFAALYSRFTDVQFFGVQVATPYAAWARAQNGRLTRLFAAGAGHVFANVGQQTAEESALKLRNLSGLSLPAAERALTSAAGGQVPGADLVFALARLWSVDPARLHLRRVEPAAGFVAQLP